MLAKWSQHLSVLLSCYILVILDYKTLPLLLVKKDDHEFVLGGRGVAVEFCFICNAIRVCMRRSFKFLFRLHLNKGFMGLWLLYLLHSVYHFFLLFQNMRNLLLQTVNSTCHYVLFWNFENVIFFIFISFVSFFNSKT